MAQKLGFCVFNSSYETEVSMRGATILMAAGALVALCTVDASARTVKISGTHSYNEIALKCINADGSFYHTTSGGYGCNTKNGSTGTTVSCDKSGHCTGQVPIKGVPPGKGNIVSILNSGVTTTKGGSGSTTRKPVNVGATNSPTQVNAPVANGHGGGIGQGQGHHR